jgi:protein-tyrosine kinase
MGRVDDAMRRAAAGATPAAPDARTLAEEAFPEERSTSAPASGAEAATAPEDTEPTDGAGSEAVAVGNAPETLLQHIDSTLEAKIVVDTSMVPASREQYRRLAAALHHAQEASGMNVVMIASAVAGEGKSLTASNLALTFSESYRRSVLLIDGDLRRPALHKVFGIEARTGLSEALSSIDEVPLSIYRVSERLTILPAGKANPDPMAGLTSVRMKKLLAEARQNFDWIFIDTPPVGLLSDANLLSRMVDAAVLVVKANSTPYQLVLRAVEALGHDRIIGTVLNQATPAHGSAYEYYHYHYHYADRPETATGL